MRCPDCGKFVAMENGEAEVDLSCEYHAGGFRISGSIRHTRNCADCSAELKAIDLSPDMTVNLSDFAGWDNLSADDQAKVKAALADDSAEMDFSPGDGEAEESGGGRYKKNLITVRVPFTISLRIEAGNPEIQTGNPAREFIELSYSGEVSEENPASAYEECC